MWQYSLCVICYHHVCYVSTLQGTSMELTSQSPTNGYQGINKDFSETIKIVLNDQHCIYVSDATDHAYFISEP